MVFLEGRFDLHAANGIRRRNFFLLLVSADSDSGQLVRGFHIGGGCPLRADFAFSVPWSAPLVEHPRRNGWRKLILSWADSLARSVYQSDSLGGFHVHCRSHLRTA